jgi:hypothetical protein
MHTALEIALPLIAFVFGGPIAGFSTLVAVLWW